MRLRLFCLGLCCVTNFASAFVPPLGVLIRETFEGRRSSPAVEVIFKHRLFDETGQSAGEIEERLYWLQGRAYSWFRTANSDFAATIEKGAYHFNGRKLPNRSAAWLRYWVGSNADDWRENLIAEKFLKRDWLQMFRPTFNPVGDPSTWDSAGNYLKPQEIYFARSKRGLVTIAAEGSAERTVHFDRNLQGLRRFEWRENGENASWSFDQYRKIAGEGNFAGRAIFRIGDSERIVTEMVSRRSLKDKTGGEAAKNLARVTKLPFSAEADEAVRLLLSYR